MTKATTKGQRTAIRHSENNRSLSPLPPSLRFNANFSRWTWVSQKIPRY